MYIVLHMPTSMKYSKRDFQTLHYHHKIQVSQSRNWHECCGRIRDSNKNLFVALPLETLTTFRVLLACHSLMGSLLQRLLTRPLSKYPNQIHLTYPFPNKPTNPITGTVHELQYPWAQAGGRPTCHNTSPPLEDSSSSSWSTGCGADG